MTGTVFCCGMLFSPWQAAHGCALSSTGSASAAPASTTAPSRDPISAALTVIRLPSPKKDGTTRPRLSRHAQPIDAHAPDQSIQREGDDVVAALGVDLHVAAGGDHDVLLAAHHVGGGRCVDAGPRVERPQHVAVVCVVGAETAVGLAREHHPAGGGENAADH